MLAIRAVPIFALAMVALMLAPWSTPGVRAESGMTARNYATQNGNPSVAKAMKDAETKAARCQIEDWRWNYQGVFRWVTIEGTATCEQGMITIRAYDDELEQFIGVAVGFIQGYVFQVLISNIPKSPLSLKIKHTIEQD